MRAKVAVALALSIFLAIVPVGASGRTSVLSPAVSDNQIRIGLHMPLTGAAPIPAESADQGSDVFWKWLRARGDKINGRYVRAIVKNDNYNPSQAVAVCKELVEEEHVFLLSGTMQPGGADQVQACSRYAASVGVPYVSLGTTQRLMDHPRYFAITKTAPQQARMLADLLVSDLGARREKNGMLSHSSPNNEDTHRAFVRTMSNRNAALVYDRSVSRNSSSAEAQMVVQEMKAAGIENVFVLTSPVWFLQVLQAARSQNYRPLWVGIQSIAAFGDTIASVGCRNGTLGRSRFLSPVPAFAGRDSFDPRHDRAMKRIYNERGDSITWLGWAGSKALRKMLERGGRDLTRQRFVRRVERTRSFRTGILPRFGFTPNDHFGGRGIHVLEVDCSRRRWETVRRFVNDF